MIGDAIKLTKANQIFVGLLNSHGDDMLQFSGSYSFIIERIQLHLCLQYAVYNKPHLPLAISDLRSPVSSEKHYCHAITIYYPTKEVYKEIQLQRINYFLKTILIKEKNNC